MARKKREPESTERPAPPREERPPDELRGSRPPDIPDVRAKSTGHGKKTADKWNQ
jgi:hypothetical protein